MVLLLALSNLLSLLCKQVGGEISQQTLASPFPPGRGGNGGGAIEVVAVNDVVIGVNGAILCDGQDGLPAYRGGGGGSGGSIMVSANGVVHSHGKLSARGGAGGAGVGLGSRGGGGGGGGRVVAYGQSLTWDASGGYAGPREANNDHTDLVDVSGGEGGLDAVITAGPNSNNEVLPPFSDTVRTADNTRGEEGTIHLVSAGGVRYRIDVVNGGAEDTQRSLRMDGDETVVTDSSVRRTAPYVQNGVTFSLPGASKRGEWDVRRKQGGTGPETIAFSEGTRPDRITFYVKIGVFPGGSVLANWGAQFAIHEYDVNTTFFNNTAEKLAGITGPVGGEGNDGVAMIGVTVVNGDWRHDANYRHTPGSGRPPPKGVFFRNAQNDRWYKVDIFIDWTATPHTYKIRLDDITMVTEATFYGDAVRSLGLYVYNAATVWWDEVQLG